MASKQYLLCACGVLVMLMLWQTAPYLDSSVLRFKGGIIGRNEISQNGRKIPVPEIRASKHGSTLHSSSQIPSSSSTSSPVFHPRYNGVRDGERNAADVRDGERNAADVRDGERNAADVRDGERNAADVRTSAEDLSSSSPWQSEPSTSSGSPSDSPRSKSYSNANVSVSAVIVSPEQLSHCLKDMDETLAGMRFKSDHNFPPDFKLTFLPNYKSPCFKEGEKVWCLPYFFIGGFPKCGTTELFAKLVRHPEILPGQKKEPHWWTRYRYTKSSKTFEFYKQFFERRLQLVEETVDGNDQHPMILTEGSASTVWDNHNLFSKDSFDTPPHLNIHVVHSVLPDARFVLILRNPVTRLYSDYLYFQKKYSPEDFHAQAVMSVRLFNACLTDPRSSFLYCMYAPSPRHAPRLYERLRVALYYVHLKVVLSVYPRANLFILQLESYMQDEVTWLRKIMSFLDVTLMSVDEIEALIQRRKAANVNKKGYKKAGPMLNETRAILEEFYKPYNVLLHNLLGEDSVEY